MRSTDLALITGVLVIVSLLLTVVQSAAFVANDEYGCLTYERAEFKGFQQPSFLNLPSTVSSPDLCSTNTLKVNTIITGPTTRVYQCQCKLGFTGLKCDFQLESTFNLQKPDFPSTRWPFSENNIVSGLSLDLLIHSSPKSHYRLRWAKVSQDGSKYEVLVTTPLEARTPALVSPNDQLQTEIVIPPTHLIPNFEASLAPIDSRVTVNTPFPWEILNNVECLTLLAFEITDDQINQHRSSTPSTPLTTQYQPIAQFTIHKYPKDLTLGTNYFPDQCGSSNTKWFVIQGVPKCACTSYLSSFGSECNYTFSWLSPIIKDVYRPMVLLNSVPPFDSTRINPPKTITGEHFSVPIPFNTKITFTITIPSVLPNTSGYRASLRLTGRPGDTAWSIDFEADLIGWVGDLTTWEVDSTALFNAGFRGEHSLWGDLSHRESFIITPWLLDPQGLQSDHAVGVRIRPQSTCAKYNIDHCNTDTTQDCSWDAQNSIGQCLCFPGYIGASCQVVVQLTTLSQGTNELAMDLDISDDTRVAFGSHLFLFLSQSSLISPSLPSSYYSKVSVRLALYNTDTLTFNPGVDVVGYSDEAVWAVKMPDMPPDGLTKDYLQIARIEIIAPDSSTPLYIQLQIISNCKSMLDAGLFTPGGRISGCFVQDNEHILITCQSGLFGPECTDSRSTSITLSNTAITHPANFPLYIDADITWPMASGSIGTGEWAFNIGMYQIGFQNSQTLFPTGSFQIATPSTNWDGRINDHTINFSDWRQVVDRDMTFVLVGWVQDDGINEGAQNGSLFFLGFVKFINPFNYDQSILRLKSDPSNLSKFIRIPQCYVPNTDALTIAPLFKADSPIETMCRCKDWDRISPKPSFHLGTYCQTSFSGLLNSSLGLLNLFIDTVEGYSRPTGLVYCAGDYTNSIFVPGGTKGSTLTFSNTFNSMELHPIKDSEQHLTNVGLMFDGEGPAGVKNINVLGFSGVSLDGTDYGAGLHSFSHFHIYHNQGINTNNDLKCFGGRLVTNSEGEVDYCLCNGNFFGKQCQFYLNIGYQKTIPGLLQLNSPITIQMSSVVPEHDQNMPEIDTLAPYYVNIYTQEGLDYPKILQFRKKLTLGEITTYQSPTHHTIGSLTRLSVFSQDDEQTYVELDNESTCGIVSDRLAIYDFTCKRGHKCDITTSNPELACLSTCIDGFFDVPIGNDVYSKCDGYLVPKRLPVTRTGAIVEPLYPGSNKIVFPCVGSDFFIPTNAFFSFSSALQGQVLTNMAIEFYDSSTKMCYMSLPAIQANAPPQWVTGADLNFKPISTPLVPEKVVTNLSYYIFTAPSYQMINYYAPLDLFFGRQPCNVENAHINLVEVNQFFTDFTCVKCASNWYGPGCSQRIIISEVPVDFGVMLTIDVTVTPEFFTRWQWSLEPQLYIDFPQGSSPDIRLMDSSGSRMTPDWSYTFSYAYNPATQPAGAIWLYNYNFYDFGEASIWLYEFETSLPDICDVATKCTSADAASFCVTDTATCFCNEGYYGDKCQFHDSTGVFYLQPHFATMNSDIVSSLQSPTFGFYPGQEVGVLMPIEQQNDWAAGFQLYDSLGRRLFTNNAPQSTPYYFNFPHVMVSESFYYYIQTGETSIMEIQKDLDKEHDVLQESQAFSSQEQKSSRISSNQFSPQQTTEGEPNQHSKTFPNNLFANTLFTYTTSTMSTVRPFTWQASGPENAASRVVYASSCDWWVDNFDGDYSLTSTDFKPCVMMPKGTSLCNLRSIYRNDPPIPGTICICSSGTDSNGNYYQSFGHKCEFLLTMPQGPYYPGQILKNIKIDVLDSRYAANPPSTLTLILNIPNTSTEISIPVTYNILQDSALSVIGWAQIPSNHQDLDAMLTTKQNVDFPTVDEGLLFRWHFVADTTRYQIVDSSFPIIEPCYWTAYTNHWITCAQEYSIVNDVFSWAAVSSCTDPTTHQISCQCKDGYMGRECRIKVTVSPSDSAPLSKGIHLQQGLKFETQWIHEKHDYQALASPDHYSFINSFGSGSDSRDFYDSVRIPGFNPETEWGKNIRYQEKSVVNAFYRESFDYSLFRFNNSFSPYLSVNVVAPTCNYHINRQQGSLGYSDYVQSIQWPLDQTGKRDYAKINTNTVAAIKDKYGLNCPANLIAPGGCLCAQTGIFGPDCGFKFDLFMGTNGTRVMSNTLWYPSQQYSYSLSRITPVAISSLSLSSLPISYHFELSFAVTEVETRETMHKRLKLRTNIANKSVRMPDIQEIPVPTSGLVYTSTLYLVSDDIAAPYHYPIQPLGIFEPVDRFGGEKCNPQGTRKMVETSQQVGALVDFHCDCLLNYYGTYCQHYYILSPLNQNYRINAKRIVPGQGDPPGAVVVEFEINFDYLENSATGAPQVSLIGYYLVTVPSSTAQLPTFYHQLTLSGHNKFSYRGVLNGYSGADTKYKLVFSHENLAPFELTEPMTISSLSPSSSSSSEEIQISSLLSSSPSPDINSSSSITIDEMMLNSKDKSLYTTSDITFNTLQTTKDPARFEDNVFTNLFTITAVCDINPLLCTIPIDIALTPTLTSSSTFSLLGGVSSHIATNPFVITHTGVKVTITIPPFSNVLTSATLKLQSYPLTSTPNQYSSTPITITNNVFDPTATQRTFQLTIPTQLIASKLFYSITMTDSTTPSSQYILVTPTFTTIPQCYTAPTTLAEYPLQGKWVLRCQNGGSCSSTTQLCECTNDFTGTSCQTAIPVEQKPCAKCPAQNINTCNVDTNQCECTPSWIGATCTTPFSCSDKSNTKCNGPDNGSLLPSTVAGKCSNQCQCNNSWSGLSCQSCALQCGHGAPFRDCNRCGCDAGYTGSNCQCQSVLGTVTINGYNEALVRYVIALKDSSPTSPSELNDMMIAADAVTETADGVFISLSGLQGGSIGVKLEPIIDPTINPKPTTTTIDNLKYTKMSLTFTFNCANFNPSVTSEGLMTLWNGLPGQLKSDEDFQNLFIFPSGEELDIENDPLTEIPPSLPPDGEGLQETHVPKDGNTTTIIIAVVCSIVGVLLLILLIVLICCFCGDRDEDDETKAKKSSKSPDSTTIATTTTISAQKSAPVAPVAPQQPKQGAIEMTETN